MSDVAQRQGVGVRRSPLYTLLVIVVPVGLLVAAAWPGLHPKVARPDPPSVSTVAPYPYPLREAVDPAVEIAFYQKRVNADPSDFQDEAMLARIYLHQARMTNDPAYFMLAEQMGKVSLEHWPNGNDNADMVVARVAEAKHDFRGSLQICEKVLREKPQEDAVLTMVTCDLGLGRVQKAHEDAERLLGMARTLSTFSTLALVEEDLGDEPAIMRAWQKAFSHEEAGDPYGSAWSRTLCGRWFFRHGRFTVADSLYREALRVFPRFPLALQQLAELDTVMGRYDEAENCYAQAYAEAPMATYLMGKARVRRLRHDDAMADALEDKAETMLRKDLVTSPTGHGRDLACLLLERGRPADRAEAVRIMLKDIGNRRDWLTLDAAAWALQADGQWAAAEKLEREALSCGIRSAQLRWRLADIETALGEPAAADYAEALHDNPNFKMAHAAVPFML